jgi:two-component system CheB/CheR fusion protein
MSEQSKDEVVIAALGASAGGLAAFEEFFRHMPADAGIAFIVVQHLAPDHASALSEILSRNTGMPVEEAQDNTRVLPNRVYTIPPNATLTVQNGTLRVTAPVQPRGTRTPIDALFRSLAEDQGQNAVCIILSGTGTDGTHGLTAIKEYGGMALAQTVESAKYDAILRSAIGTGLVDYVLPVKEMPAKLLEYAAHLNSVNGRSEGIREELGPHLSSVHTIIRNRAGHDFSEYKEGTIARRLDRRMKTLQIESVGAYMKVLETQPEEADQLFKDLLIGVTQFFRDPAAFDALSREVIPKLFEGKKLDEQVRACVVGCASGEEAYSLAILLSEHAATLSNSPKIQIFATDIDERTLEMARRGRYPESISEHVSPERIVRFFNKQDSVYQVKREVRERIIFSTHSFIKDPPFSRLDLISCRNVMIYLGRDLQHRVVSLFHYALRTGGYLFLGPSESVSSHRELFQAVDKKHQIYQRKQTLPRPALTFPLTTVSRTKPTRPLPIETMDRPVVQQFERIVSERYGPACAIIRENGEAVYFSARVGRYLHTPAGSPDSNVLNMAPDGLRSPLRAALHKALTTRERAVQRGLPIQLDRVVRHVNLTVDPVTVAQAELFMVVLEEVELAAPASDMRPDATAEETIKHLENALRTAEEQARAAYEELETSNEELQSANEEYQSTNEELETSKEELQSFNEELETVNAELSRKVNELDHANSDLQNFFDSTQLATIFMDSELRIKKYTPSAGNLFRLLSTDTGRPITDMATQFLHDGLVNDIREVLRSLVACERQADGANGEHYQIKIAPYRTIHNVIDGVAVTFTDVTALRNAELQAHIEKTAAENIVNTVREPMLVLDPSLRVRSANDSFITTFKIAPDLVLGKHLYELDNGQWNIPDLRRLLTDLLPTKKAVEGFEVNYNFAHVGPKTLLVNARQIDHAPLILLAIEDITERKKALEDLTRVNDDLRHFAYAASHDLQEPLRMVMSYTQLLEREYKDRLGPAANQFIGYAVQGAQRMETLLKDLREFWSVNEQKHADRVPLDSEQIVRKAVDLLGTQIRETGATVTYDSLPSSVMAEETPLTLVFKNLIANGLKYRRVDVSPTVHVSATEDVGLYTFSVKDNGIGIEAEHLKVIFAPFKRLHGAE